MKATLSLLVLITSQTCVFTERDSWHSLKILFKPSHILKSPLQSEFNFWPSKHLLNPKPVKLNTKSPNSNNFNYTLFPYVNPNVRYYAPDSPYFPLEPNYEHKTRIKKVLPDYYTELSRSKRSANAELKKVDKNSDQYKSKEEDNDIKEKSAKSKRKNARKFKKNLRNSKNSNHNLKSRLQKSRLRRNHKSAKAKLRKYKENAGRRLIGGKDAQIEDYPYVVSIQKNGRHWCAGALLNPRLVITTANCVWKSNRDSTMTIRAGSRHSDRLGQIAGIQEVMKHPNWSIRKNPDNDLALLLLDKSIKFSDAVHSVDLPNKAMLPPFDDAWVTGWGSAMRDGKYKEKFDLQVYHTQLVDRDKCNNVTQRFGVTVTNNFICLSQVGKRAPCTRDTGAPAVSDGVVWGLASWGIRKFCGTERFPAVFSYTASISNMDFIMNATRKLMSDKRQSPFLDNLPMGRK